MGGYCGKILYLYICTHVDGLLHCTMLHGVCKVNSKCDLQPLVKVQSGEEVHVCSAHYNCEVIACV